MSYAKKVDLNHADVVKTLRSLGNGLSDMLKYLHEQTILTQEN